MSESRRCDDAANAAAPARKFGKITSEIDLYQGLEVGRLACADADR
jgi:hypothetical protein